MKAIVSFNPETSTFQLSIGSFAVLYNSTGLDDEIRDYPETEVYLVELNEDSNIYIENNKLTLQDVKIIKTIN